MVLNPLEWFMWRKPEGVTLDRDYEQEIMRTALLARRADDPEAAWFVAHYARDRLRLTWLYLAQVVFFTAIFAWTVASRSIAWWSFVLLFMALASAWFLFGFRRLRLNVGIATPPPGLEEMG